MQRSPPLQNPVAWLMGLVRRLQVPNATDTFLRSRNARLIVQDAVGSSFHVVRLTSQCDVVAGGRHIRLRVKLIADQMVRVTVIDKKARNTLVDVTAPVDPGSDVMYLNFPDMRLRIEVDAVRPDEN